jgi:hypothetical protein
MPMIFLIRVACVVTTVFLTAIIHEQATWVSVVYSFGLAHYLISLIYSKNQINELLDQAHALVPLFAVFLLGAALYLSQFALIFYFAFHHAFNEAYVVDRTISAADSSVKAFRGSAVLLHLFIYFFLLRRGIGLHWTDVSLVLAGLVACAVVFFYYLYRIRSLLNFSNLLENSAFEFLLLLLAGASFFITFTFHQIVLFHFIFWSIFPIPKLLAVGSNAIWRYAGLTAACVAGFFLLSPAGVFSYPFQGSRFEKQFVFWSYVHITASLALSNAHPRWIIDLFRLQSARQRPSMS